MEVNMQHLSWTWIWSGSCGSDYTNNTCSIGMYFLRPVLHVEPFTQDTRWTMDWNRTCECWDNFSKNEHFLTWQHLKMQIAWSCKNNKMWHSCHNVCLMHVYIRPIITKWNIRSKLSPNEQMRTCRDGSVDFSGAWVHLECLHLLLQALLWHKLNSSFSFLWKFINCKVLIQYRKQTLQ